MTTLNVTEDSTAPAASILCNGAACSAGWYTASPVSVTLAAPDAGAGLDQIRYTTDGTDPTIFTGTSTRARSRSPPRASRPSSTARSTGSATTAACSAQTVRIDTVAPDTTIDSDAGRRDAGHDADLRVQLAGAGARRSRCASTAARGRRRRARSTLGPLAENTYTFDVRAIDVAGNVDATPASFTFTVDTTPANTTITSSPPADVELDERELLVHRVATPARASSAGSTAAPSPTARARRRTPA